MRLPDPVNKDTELSREAEVTEGGLGRAWCLDGPAAVYDVSARTAHVELARLSLNT